MHRHSCSKERELSQPPEHRHASALRVFRHLHQRSQIWRSAKLRYRHDVTRLLRCGWAGARHLVILEAIYFSAIFRVFQQAGILRDRQKHNPSAANCNSFPCFRFACILLHPTLQLRYQPTSADHGLPASAAPGHGDYVTVAKKRVLKCLRLRHATTRALKLLRSSLYLSPLRPTLPQVRHKPSRWRRPLHAVDLTDANHFTSANLLEIFVTMRIRGRAV